MYTYLACTSAVHLLLTSRLAVNTCYLDNWMNVSRRMYTWLLTSLLGSLLATFRCRSWTFRVMQKCTSNVTSFSVIACHTTPHLSRLPHLVQSCTLGSHHRSCTQVMAQSGRKRWTLRIHMYTCAAMLTTFRHNQLVYMRFCGVQSWATDVCMLSQVDAIWYGMYTLAVFLGRLQLDTYRGEYEGGLVRSQPHT